MKSTNIQIFKNDSFGEVRVTEIDGKTYFVGSDVAKALGYVNPRDAIIRHCKSGGVVKYDTPVNNVIQQVTYIDEGNLYRLIAKSELPAAEKFETWIFDDVLPTIRKHGAYITPAKTEELLLNPDLIIQLATTLKIEREKRILAETVAKDRTIELDKSKEWWSIKRWAKQNNLNWRKINWRALKAISHEHGYPIDKIFDANYGQVNIYHKNVFDIYFSKPNVA